MLTKVPWPEIWLLIGTRSILRCGGGVRRSNRHAREIHGVGAGRDFVQIKLSNSISTIEIVITIYESKTESLRTLSGIRNKEWWSES